MSENGYDLTPHRNDDTRSSMAGRVIMRTAYGIDVQDNNDPYIDIAERGLQALNAGVNAGSFLVDIVPICKRLRNGLLAHLSHIFRSETYSRLVSRGELQEAC